MRHIKFTFKVKIAFLFRAKHYNSLMISYCNLKREGKGLEFASRGRISYRLELVSNLICKLRFFWYFESEALAKYLLLALAVERVVALYHPVAVRHWATRRNARLLIAAIVLLSVFGAIPSLFEYALTQSPFGATGAMACLWIYKHIIQLVTLILFTVLINNLLPEVAVLVCLFIMSYKIKKASKVRRQMQPQFGSYNDSRRPRNLLMVPLNNPTNGPQILVSSRSGQQQGAGSQRQIQNLQLAMSVLVLSALEVLMYLIYSLVWLTFGLQIFIQAPNKVRSTLLSIGSIITSSMIVIRIWRLYIYYFTIRGFRTALKCVVYRCCCAGRQPESMQLGDQSGSFMVAAQLSQSQMSMRRPRVPRWCSSSRIENSRQHEIPISLWV